GAAAMQAIAPFGFRYQYLAGGVNTGNGWASWNPNGSLATYYIQDSIDHGMIPVFIYYMLLQSNPASGSDEGTKDYNNLQNVSTMTAYFNDLKLLFQRAGAFPSTPVVIDVEPDFWGFMQQRATRDDASTVSAQVASTGLPELAGLPNNVAGFAQAVVRLRDTYAPNVLLAYDLSIWGTGNDIVYTNPDNATVVSLATRSANFFRSLNAAFDLTSNDPSDRDAGFKQYVYGDGGAGWWDAADYARHVLYLSTFTSQVQKRIFLWQIPLGNTKMLAQNNTWNHYQDNHVEWLLDDPGRTHLNDYVQAGVVALLFGRGADGATCNCDANNDGVTNPPPINGNTMPSFNADDDGGFFQDRAKAYYAAGAMALPGGGSSSPTATPTSPPTATATSVVQPTSTPAATTQPGFVTGATVSSTSVPMGGTEGITATVASATATTV